jgi:hypothetical protein
VLLLLLAVASIATQRSPDSVGICEFTPASETISLSWASIGQFMSQVFSYGPAGSGYCLVPKATTKGHLAHAIRAFPRLHSWQRRQFHYGLFV